MKRKQNYASGIQTDYSIHGFIVYTKTDDIYKDIEEDVETRFNTLNYKLNRPFPRQKNKNAFG